MTSPFERRAQRSVRLLAAVSIQLLVLLPTATAAHAQELLARISTCGEAARGLGTVQGHLIADSAGISLDRGVLVNFYACEGVADSSGRYSITGLPPGTYGITVGDIGVRRVPPIMVRVGPDSATTLDIHLRPENVALDCLDDPGCRTTIVPLDSTHQRQLSDDEQLLEIAARTTAGLAQLWTEDIARRPGALCVALGEDDQTTSLPGKVLAVVQVRVPIARPDSDCRIVRDSVGLEYQTADGLWAWRLRVATRRAAVATGDARISYHVGMLWAAGWLCRFERTARGWQPQHCRMEWIS
jgi:hypothetical protein